MFPLISSGFLEFRGRGPSSLSGRDFGPGEILARSQLAAISLFASTSGISLDFSRFHGIQGLGVLRLLRTRSCPRNFINAMCFISSSSDFIHVRGPGCSGLCGKDPAPKETFARSLPLAFPSISISVFGFFI